MNTELLTAYRPHSTLAGLACAARRLGVKVRTERGVAVYGLSTAPVIRVAKVTP